MNHFVHELAVSLAENGAPGLAADHEAALAELHAGVRNASGSEAVADAVFGYIANHHYFDLNSIEMTRCIVLVLTEICCPLAQDDSRSKAFFEYLSAEMGGRAHGL